VNVAKNRAPHSRRPQPLRPPSYNSGYCSGSASLCRLLPRPGRGGKSHSDLHETPVTSRKSRPLRNPFRIRSYRNPARNSFRMRSYKTTQGVVGPPLSINPTLCSLRRRQPQPGRSGKSLCGLHESPVTTHKSRLFMRLRALFLSCSSFPDADPLFSITSGLFVKNTRGGIPLPDIHESQVTSHKSRPSSCAESQKRASVSPFSPLLQTPCRVTPFPATHTQTLGMGVSSFPNFSRHSPLATCYCSR
jgi:hypothetical protein